VVVVAAAAVVVVVHSEEMYNWLKRLDRQATVGQSADKQTRQTTDRLTDNTETVVEQFKLERVSCALWLQNAIERKIVSRTINSFCVGLRNV